jgi:hypothetical protein
MNDFIVPETGDFKLLVLGDWWPGFNHLGVKVLIMNASNAWQSGFCVLAVALQQGTGLLILGYSKQAVQQIAKYIILFVCMT